MNREIDTWTPCPVKCNICVGWTLLAESVIWSIFLGCDSELINFGFIFYAFLHISSLISLALILVCRKCCLRTKSCFEALIAIPLIITNVQLLHSAMSNISATFHKSLLCKSFNKGDRVFVCMYMLVLAHLMDWGLKKENECNFSYFPESN